MKTQILNRLARKLFGIAFTLLLLFSCTDKYMEINMDKTKMMEVGAKEYSGLFTRAIIKGIAWTTTDDMSRMSSTMGLHLCGYISCGIQTKDQNEMGYGWQNAGFNDVYTDAIPASLAIMDVAEAEGNIAAYNVAQIWKVFQFQRVTDLWGAVPYSEAGTGKEAIAYESQRDIYYKMFEEITSAVDALTEEVQKNPGLNIFGIGDLIYQGDVSKWIKFANTLRLRMAIRISNIEPEKAKLEGEAAVATGAMLETNADDAMAETVDLLHDGNGMPRMESFFQDIMSTNMESFLKGYNDPRMGEYWSPVVNDLVMKRFPQEYKDNIGGYHGFCSGSDPAAYYYFRAYSKYGERFKDGMQYITPINVMNAAETYFLKAEGAWRGWNMGGTAQSFYEKGIEISIKQWKGASYSMSTINEYINGTSIPIAPENPPYYDPPMTDIPVKFSSDRTTQYEQIHTQKWIALFPISFEAFAEYRRTRLPKLYPKKYSVNTNIDVSKGQIITRLPYTNDEKSANAKEVEKATLLLKGPDLESTPLWWDVNPN